MNYYYLMKRLPLNSCLSSRMKQEPYDIDMFANFAIFLMDINVECEFRDWGSIPSMYQITDADLGQVG